LKNLSGLNHTSLQHTVEAKPPLFVNATEYQFHTVDGRSTKFRIDTCAFAAPPTLHRHTLYMWPQGDSSLEFPVVENNYYLGNDTEAIEEMEEKVSYHGLVVLAERGSMFLVKTQAAGSRSTLVIERDVDTFFGMYMVS